MPAKIVPITLFSKARPFFISKRLVAVSGGFDPLHPGHISNIQEAKKLGDCLVVIVNGDSFLTRKKGKPFLPLKTRMQIIAGLEGVDFVVDWNSKSDNVIGALELVQPDIFAKGGDRTDKTNIPEWETCKRLGCEIVVGVGKDKAWSSSDFLVDWVNFFKEMD